MYWGTHMSQHLGGDPTITMWSWFSPSIYKWVPMIKFNLQFAWEALDPQRHCASLLSDHLKDK